MAQKAYWQERRRADGGISIQIKWRPGGDSTQPWESETFTNPKNAADFKARVEDEGRLQWPDGWVKGQGLVEVDDSVMTFEKVAESYFAAERKRIKNGEVKGTTIEKYERIAMARLYPYFGSMPFADITLEDVEGWIEEAMDFGADKTIKNWKGVLSPIMIHGIGRLKLRLDNPCRFAKPPKRQTEDAPVKFLQPEEWALLRSCFLPDVVLMMDITLMTGLRYGEFTALRISDLTFNADGQIVNIWVARAWSRRARNDSDRIKTEEGENLAWKVGLPKSKKGRYVQVVGDEFVERLQQHIQGRSPSEYLFVTPKGNPWRYPDFHSDRWAPAIQDARSRGLSRNVTPHMLRHTTVVWGGDGEVPVNLISHRLGHADIAFTNRVYGGILNLKDARLGAAVGKAMTTANGLAADRPTLRELQSRPVRTRPRTKAKVD
jgi:integrase